MDLYHRIGFISKEHFLMPELLLVKLFIYEKKTRNFISSLIVNRPHTIQPQANQWWTHMIYPACPFLLLTCPAIDALILYWLCKLVTVKICRKCDTFIGIVTLFVIHCQNPTRRAIGPDTLSGQMWSWFTNFVVAPQFRFCLNIWISLMRHQSGFIQLSAVFSIYVGKNLFKVALLT